MADRRWARSRLFAFAMVAGSTLGCAEAVRPVLGGLKIGPGVEGPFVMPMLINDRPPFAYPQDAWERGVGGETTLRIHISSAGFVDSVLVAKSSGDAVLDSASVAGALLMQYRPARHGDSPVAVWAYLPVRYPMPEAGTVNDGSRDER